MDTLRSRLIRLAHTQPSLRPQLLPLLKTAALDPRASAKLKEIDAVLARLDPLASQLEKDLYPIATDVAALARSNRDADVKEIADQISEAKTEAATVALRIGAVRRTIRDLLEP